MVFLLTDCLLFVLIFAAVAYALYARGKTHLQEPWRRLLRSRIAVASIVVLSFYVGIAVLDSLHFEAAQAAEGEQQGPAVVSLFDRLYGPAGYSYEKTYSAPFAAHSFVKEPVTVNGVVAREYARLEYGGAHLEDPEHDKAADIVLRLLSGIAEALLIWAVIALVFLGLYVRRNRMPFTAAARNVLCGRTEVPWHVGFIVLGLMLALCLTVANLRMHYHVFGTDKIGEDVLYQTLKSVRTGILIGTLTTLIMLPFALVLGMMAGYFRGWIDDVIQFIYTTLNSIPGVLLIAAAVMIMHIYIESHPDQYNSLIQRADIRLFFLCMILGVTSWTGLCRLLRAETLKLRQIEFVEAATAFGVGPFRIMLRHILPSVMHIVLINIALDFSGLVLAEAVLSYIEIGVDPTMQSWGNMINSARLELAREPIVWWPLTAAFIMMFTLVLFANLFADSVRDAFDPRLREGVRS